MKRIGVFAEFQEPGETGAPSVRDAVRQAPSANEDKIVRYLMSGIDVMDVMGRSPDVIDGSPVALTFSLATDGVWYWRHDLAHYVARHHIELEADFLDYVASRDYRPPGLDDAAARRAADEVLRVDGWGSA